MDWQVVEEVQQLSGFTHESAIEWATTANTHMSIKCKDAESGKVSMTFFTIVSQSLEITE